MGKLVLLLGGARSGKSAYAEHLARELGDNVLFVATATAGDDDMAQRIAAHRAARPTTWRTIEVPSGVAAAVSGVTSAVDTVILDCLTLLVSNLLLAPGARGEAEVTRRVDEEIAPLLDQIAADRVTWIVVSNEVGLGIVPASALGRTYRDLLGRVNQRVAARADEVYLMVASLPLDLKRLSAKHD